MSPFHSGMNHWQRQWLSDRLHKKQATPPSPLVPPVPPPVEAPRRRKPTRSKAKPPEQSGS